MKLIEDDKWDFVMSKVDTHRLSGGQVDGLRGLGAGGQSDWSLLRWEKLNLCSVPRYLDRWETFEVSWRGKRTWTLCLCFERSGQLRGICPDRVFDINIFSISHQEGWDLFTSGQMKFWHNWPGVQSSRLASLASQAQNAKPWFRNKSSNLDQVLLFLSRFTCFSSGVTSCEIIWEITTQRRLMHAFFRRPGPPYLQTG